MNPQVQVLIDKVFELGYEVYVTSSDEDLEHNIQLVHMSLDRVIEELKNLNKELAEDANNGES